MPVTDDEMYRQLAADYSHHLGWREKLFGGFLVLIAALALASTTPTGETNRRSFCLGSAGSSPCSVPRSPLSSSLWIGAAKRSWSTAGGSVTLLSNNRCARPSSQVSSGSATKVATPRIPEFCRLFISGVSSRYSWSPPSTLAGGVSDADDAVYLVLDR